MITDNLFEVIGRLHESFKGDVAKFEAVLQAIVNLDQCLMLTAFKQDLQQC